MTIVNTTLSVDQQAAESHMDKAISIPCLSIVYHPDLRRIGERSLLSTLNCAGRAESIELSRLAPLFFHPYDENCGMRGRSLGDPYLSRTPVVIEYDGDDEFSISCQDKHGIFINGRNEKLQRFSSTALEDGLVIEFSGRVVLLLHFSTAMRSSSNHQHGIVGYGSATEALRRVIDKVADLSVPILVRGESGTGKELVAKAIHRASQRVNQPYVCVNMAAISESLALAVLFGSYKGAYTGRHREQKGFFREADTGTLFIDEVGDIPETAQVSLLRALETGEIQPVGASRPVKVNTRIISATDAILEDKINPGEFRKPLFQHLASFEIRILPLRERREDIGPLMQSLLGEILCDSEQVAFFDGTPTRVSQWCRIFSRFCRHDWPGNVRQLKHYLTQVIINSHGEQTISLPQHLNDILPANTIKRSNKIVLATSFHGVVIGENNGGHSSSQDLQKNPQKRKPRDISSAELEATLLAHQWDVKASADSLNISRASLYNLIDRHPKLRRARDISNEEFRHAYQLCEGNINAVVAKLKVSRQIVQRRVKEIRQQAHFRDDV